MRLENISQTVKMNNQVFREEAFFKADQRIFSIFSLDFLEGSPKDALQNDIDESLTTQGFSTYSTKLAGGGWFTDIYDEQGTFVLSACDSAHTTVSGTFSTTLTDNNVLPATSIVITDGKISNLKYRVLN